jgi:hypothetical protein
MECISEIDCKIVCKVENPTASGLTLIDYELTCEQETRHSPLHWRVGTWEKPPIDVEIDSESGQLWAIQLVLQEETVPLQKLCKSSFEHQSGVPIFNRSLWLPEVLYYDEKVQVFTAWNSQDELCTIFVTPPAQVALECHVSNTLSLLFDLSMHLIGFKFREFTDVEKAMIQKAKPK